MTDLIELGAISRRRVSLSGSWARNAAYCDARYVYGELYYFHNGVLLALGLERQRIIGMGLSQNDGAAYAKH